MNAKGRSLLLIALSSAFECVGFAQYSNLTDTTYTNNKAYSIMHVNCDSLQRSFRISSNATDVVESSIGGGDKKTKYPILVKTSSRYIDVLNNRVATKDGENGFKSSIGYYRTDALPLPPGVPGEIDYRYPYKYGVGLKLEWKF